MKKKLVSFVAIAAAVAAVFSCSRKEIEVPDKQGDFQYRFEIVDSDTRALFNDQGVFWETDKDKVGVILDDNSEADVVEEGGTKYIVLNSSLPVQDATSVYAYYPYQEGSEAANAIVFFNPDQQGGAVSSMPLAGIPAEVQAGTINGRINFLNLGSIVDFRVYSETFAGETVESITFKATGSNTHVAGTAKLNLMDVKYGDGMESFLILNWGNGTPVDHATVSQEAPVYATKALATAAEATPTYLFLAPGAYESGTITVTTNAAVYTFNFENQTLSRNKIKKFNMNLDNAVREAFTKTYQYIGQVTDQNPLTEGTYLIIGYESSGGLTTCVFPTFNEKEWTSTSSGQTKTYSGDVFDQESVSPVDNKITTDDPKIIRNEVEFIESEQGGTWLIKVKSNGQYLAPEGSKDYKIKYVSEPTAFHEIGKTTNSANNYFRLNGYYFYHSGSASGYTYRTTSTCNLQFYKLDAEATSLSQTLSFGETTEFDWDLTNTGDFEEPQLDGAKTSVTYESSKTQIATVDEEGNVTFNENHKIGTVTITAHAAAENGYAAAEASYVIHVTDADLPSTTYYKATALESPANSVEQPYEYMIVSASNSVNYALQNNEGSLEAVEVSVASDQIVMPENATLLWTATAAVSGNNYGTHSLNNGTTYLTRNSTNLVGGTGSSGNYVVWRYDGEDLWNGNSTNYYVYYDSGWKLAQSNAATVNATLYTARAPRTVAFSPAAAEYDKAHPEDFVRPQLPTGITATYISSDPDNVEVDPESGEIISINKKGEYTITATIAPTFEYQGTTASYTLTVVNTEETAVTYYKASIMDSGYPYVIVSQGQAVKSNGTGKNVAAQAVTIKEDDTIDLYEDQTEGILWTATAVSGNDRGTHTLTNGNLYLYRSSSNLQGYSNAPSNSYNNYVWNYDGEDLWNKGSSSSYYAYYNSGWKLDNSKDTGKAVLYTARLPRVISFNPTTVEYDLANPASFVAPTLSGAVGATVTYNSSDETVATVAADGTLTVLKKTSSPVTIKATIAPTSEYQGASASYELTVVNTGEVPKLYTKVTSASDLEAGAKYLVVFEGISGDTDGDGDPKVFDPLLNEDGTLFPKQKASAIDVTITEGTITSADFDDCQFTLESGYYLKADKAGKYLYPGSNSDGGALLAESTATNKLSITFSSGIAQIKEATSGTYYLVWSTSSHYFSSNTSVSGTYSTGICLYKLEDDRTPQSFEFTPSMVEYDFDAGGDFPEPSFTVEPVGTVTYSSDNAAVATVNSSTGEVTVLKAGTAVITATAAGNDSYRAHSASYTIHSNTEKVQKWYKADEIVDGEQYLIVSNGYALRNNSGSVAAQAVEVNSGVIEYDAPEDVIWTTTASSSKFTFKNNGNYLYRSRSSLSISSSSSTWSYSSTDEYITTSGSSSTYYLYYSSSDSKFAVSSSQESTHIAALYTTTKPKDGRNLQFNPTSVTYDIAVGGTFTAPTLTGEKTDDVTYSSSNTSVASVNASTGAVEIKGVVGTAIITASANETETYKAGQATYTIKVKDGNASVARYVLASSIEDGKSYIIVSGGYALKNNNGSVASVAVTPEGDALEFTPGEEDDLVWTSTAESGFTSNGHFVLSNGGYRMNRVSSSGNFSLSLVETSTAMDKYGVWDLQTYDSDTYLYHDSSSTMRLWVYYSDGWKVTYRQNNTNPSSTEKPTRLYVAE